MSAFLDTNILVYAQVSGAKAERSRELLAAGGKLSIQVLNEFVAVSRRKLHRDWHNIAEAIEDVLTLLDPPLPLTIDVHRDAVNLAQSHGLHFYDALIVASALAAGCETLFSEDMQHGRSFGNLVIINPFLASP